MANNNSDIQQYPVSNLIAGAGNATLATAIAATNTAIAAEITRVNALTGTGSPVPGSNVVVGQIQLLYNGTIYVASATVSYTSWTTKSQS